jgi:hypothetical protein
VRNDGFWDDRDLPARVLKSPTKVHVFGKHEIPFIKSADRLKGVTAHNKECSTNPIDVTVATR